MTIETLSPVPVQRFYDNSGFPLVGGKLFTYIAGTTTKQSTFTDSTGGTPNANPTILDYRGEARIWIPPNVAYKYVLSPSTDTDPPTAPIWTVDQLVSSQLITLYGGVDTGSANAYVLNFVSNFTAYTDGIIIYWVPANTNTTASTINVNGIGVVNIVNPDGSALSAAEIVANQPAQILFKAGSFQLITPAGIATGVFTPGYSGFSANPGGTINYRKSGPVIALTLVLGTGTSNSTQFVVTGMPSIIQTANLGQIIPVAGLVDNGAAPILGYAKMQGSQIAFYKSLSSLATTGDWTNVGTKGFGTNCFATLVYSQ
jgi:hypothetical protein